MFCSYFTQKSYYNIFSFIVHFVWFIAQNNARIGVGINLKFFSWSSTTKQIKENILSEVSEKLTRASNKPVTTQETQSIINSDKDYSGQFEKRAKRSSIK